MISLVIKIPHLKIAPSVGNLEVGNLDGIHSFNIVHPKNGLILPTGQWYAPSAVINDALIMHYLAHVAGKHVASR